MAKELNSEEEADKLLTDKGPLMIIYYAEWCGHCQRMLPIWDELANKVGKKAKVYKIESAKYPKVTSFPKAKIVKGKKVVKVIEGGGQSVEELTKSLLSIGGKRTRRRYTRRFVRGTRKSH
jgi:thioredoxin 1